MQSLLDELQKQLSPDAIHSIGQQLGTDDDTTASAISSALPMLIGGLSYNTHNKPQGAQQLNRALERDHDGSFLDQLSGMLGGAGSGAGGGLLGGLLGQVLGQGGTRSRSTNGGGILEHILGQRRGAVERGVSQTSGLDIGKTGQLLALLAPIVMGALGKMKRQNNLNEAQLEQVLDQDRRRIEERIPGAQQGGLLNILDTNKDGKVDMRDDIAKVGMALGAAFLMSRRGRG